MPAPEDTAPSYSSDSALNASIQETLDAVGVVDPEDDGGLSEDGGAVEPQDGSQAPSPRADGSTPAGQDDDSQAPAASADGEPPEPEIAFEPFAYTVNGESRTLDGFHVVPGEGVYIPTDQVPRLQQIASRAEASEAALREMHQRTQATDRASTWTVYGEDGKPQQTLSGIDAIQQMRVDHAKMQAALEVLSAPYKSAEALLGLFTQDPQTGALQINPREVQNLVTAGQLAQMRAEARVRQTFGSAPQAAQPSAQAQASPVSLTPEQSLPAVQHLATAWGVKGLTQDDYQILAQALPRYTRAATPEDVATDPLLKVGQPVVENSFQALVAHQATLRAQQSTAGKAGQFNRGQQAGRAGQRPPARPQPAPAPAPAANGKRPKVKADWDGILTRGMEDPEVQAALRGER